MNEIKKESVLVVEDDADQRNAMSLALREAGISSIGVSDIREALLRLKNQKFSCVVLDLLLGNESGTELIDIIRTRIDAQNSPTPILVVSANLSKETVEGLLGKVQGAMVKPLDMNAFVAYVNKLTE